MSSTPRLALAAEAGACRDGCPKVSASLTSVGWPTRPSHTQLKPTLEPSLSFASKPGLIIYVSHLIGNRANKLHFPLWCLRVVAPRPGKWVHPVKRKRPGEPTPTKCSRRTRRPWLLLRHWASCFFLSLLVTWWQSRFKPRSLQ